MKKLPSQSVLKDLLDYDPATGVLLWKQRGEAYFKATKVRSATHIANCWNSDNAGKKALNSPQHGHREGSIFNQRCFAHRVIWKWVTGEDPIEIDHIDGDGSNNRWSNLRSVGMKINSRNCKRCRRNSTGVTGVSWKPTLGKYRVRVMVDGKDHHLGLFATIEEATVVRDSFYKDHNFHQNHGRAA